MARKDSVWLRGEETGETGIRCAWLICFEPCKRILVAFLEWMDGKGCERTLEGVVRMTLRMKMRCERRREMMGKKL